MPRRRSTEARRSKSTTLNRVSGSGKSSRLRTSGTTGRPSIDPELLLRILLIGYLYGISSEHKLVEERRMHLAWRWFTGLGFDSEVPQCPPIPRSSILRWHSLSKFLRQPRRQLGSAAAFSRRADRSAQSYKASVRGSNETGCLQNCHLCARSELEPLLGFGNIDWKWTTDPGTGFPMLLEILVDRFSEIAVAGFLNVVAGGEEHNACPER